MFNERKLKMSDCMWTWPSGLTAFRLVLSREHHSSSSFGEHAVRMSSYNWLPDKKTIFQEYRAVWHWSPASAVRIHKRELQSEFPTSAVVYIFDLDVDQRDARLDGVNLVDLARRCKTKPFAI